MRLPRAVLRRAVERVVWMLEMLAFCVSINTGTERELKDQMRRFACDNYSNSGFTRTVHRQAGRVRELGRRFRAARGGWAAVFCFRGLVIFA